MHRDAATRRIGRAAPVGRRGTTLMAALTAALLAGCTMCPDPFDYSGPVPNGNVAQNDFRARSNGIRPLGGQPPTWPQIVGASPRPANDGPVPALAGPGRGAFAVEPASATVADPTVADPTVADPTIADRIPRDAILPRGLRLAAVEVGDDEEAGGQPTSTMPGSGHQPSGTTASFGTTATPSRTR